MDKNALLKPTDAELEILNVLWEKGATTVREVNETLNKQQVDGREIGYTTTLKLMQIMAEKGLVQRDTSSRTHEYAAAFSREKIQAQLLQRFVDSTFQGSAMQLVLQALGNHQASEQELQEIRDLIERMERKD
jgi:BlaI family transcriptional regulator, penicillinase repressor